MKKFLGITELIELNKKRSGANKAELLNFSLRTGLCK